MAKVISWNADEFKRQLKRRLDAARRYRETFEAQWKTNLGTLNNPLSQKADQFNITFDNVIELESGEVDSGDSEAGFNYVFKYIRFWHSQMSANPPSVLPRPRSSDPSDRRKADAADRIVKYLMKIKEIPDNVDQMNLNALTFGTGYIKVVWDPESGSVFDFNEETSEVTMGGDHLIYAPNVDDVWLDPDARRRSDVRYVIERIVMPLEEACFKFPDHVEDLKRVGMDSNEAATRGMEPRPGSSTDMVEIFEYYERAQPINGMAGRHAVFLSDGTPLRFGRNPHYKGRLPYKILTYIDVPGQVYGKSVIEYATRPQELLNRMDSSIVDSIQAHGVVRFAVHESSEIEDGAVSNSAWDWIKYSGDQPPHFLAAPTLMQDIWRYREQLLIGIQEMFGVNDNMQGIQRREQSAVSQQTAIESGTMVHRRLMTKYSRTTEELYEDALGLVRDNWAEERTVLVLGKEKSFEVADFKGADIAGGFDLDVSYGTSLPLDPNMAREQLMLMLPVLKEAGVTPKQILQRFRLNELEGVLDRMDLAADRQREIFEEMVANLDQGPSAYIKPRELEEHAGMLEYAYDYVMTMEYKVLPDEAKQLIDQHILEREQLEIAKQTKGAGAAQPPQPAVGAMPLGLPDAPEMPMGLAAPV